MKYEIKKVKDIVNEYGNRYAVRQIVNSYIMHYYSLSLSDLPDTLEICNLIDELEGILTSMMDNDAFDWREIENYLDWNINDDFIKETIFS